MNKSGEFYIGLILTMLMIMLGVMLGVATVDAMSEMTTQNVSKIIGDIQNGK